MDMDTALFYLGVQTYKAMQAEEALTRIQTRMEELEQRITELEKPEKEGGQ